MGGRGVTEVGFPAIARELKGLLAHEFVAIGLGENGRGSDGEVFAVPFDDAFVRGVVVGFVAVPINQP